MIITRAPMRISFVGGGTDIAEFYTRYPGRVLSTSIDKYVYVASHSGYSENIILKYSKTETVKEITEIEHTRFREALNTMGIGKGIEIASFADLPANTGLGSSSSFSVALMKNLFAVKGEKKSKEDIARVACELEIDILKEPIGKQDQYAASYGGINMIQFNEDGSVTVEPLFIDYEFRSRLEEHLLLFFTGLTRSASAVLSVQKQTMDEKFEVYKEMSDSVLVFKDKLLAKDIQGMADMLHEGWMKKKSLSSGIATSVIDSLYEAGRAAGAWGGKLLGAGGGGCLLFVAPPEKHAAIRATLENIAQDQGLQDFKDIHFSLTQGGVDVLFNTDNNQSYV